MRSPRLAFSAVLILGVLATSLNAGVYMQSISRSSDHPQDEINQKIYVEADRMRVEMSGGDSDMITIFRMDKEAFWVIDREKGTYMEITKQDLEEMRKEMEKAWQTFEEQMKNMPPEQRDMMQAMMKDKLPAKTPEMTYKKIASNEKINRWICDKYEGLSEGEKTMDVWTVDWKSLRYKPDQFKVMAEMGKFFSEFVKDSAPFFLYTGDEGMYEGDQEPPVSGLPVKSVAYSGDQITHTTEVIEIKEQDFSSSLFKLPEGLKKEKMRRE